MSFTTVETSLVSASKQLDEISNRRERLIKESRDAIAFSSKAIVSVHKSNIPEAKKLRTQAGKAIDILRVVAGSDLAKYILVPEQEYVECSVMLSVATDSHLPSLQELGVKPSSYILGLLDAVGELKRLVYDSIRLEDPSSAESAFSTMETIYTLVTPFAVYDNIVQGVKRKLDIARSLIDDTRATITEESRRGQFVKAVNELSLRIGLRSSTHDEEITQLRDSRTFKRKHGTEIQKET